MNDFSGEIGQKMRSAVKAKLIELGSGQAGYIDDELPDYVMIMVANKRSKQQMVQDLNLFLGEQTELFVNWLHEVLQKLQEVTLPVASAPSKKQKSKSSKDKDSSNKKDKKSSRKDKKSSPDSEVPTTTTADAALAAFPTINDVFAGELLQKAQKTLDVEVNAKAEIKKGKGKKNANNDTATEASPTDSSMQTNDFDIPTISEISSTTEGQKKTDSKGSADNNLSSREKDLAELAEIQRQIEAAKRHLKAKGELPNDQFSDHEEIMEEQVDKERDSVDRDYLNLKDDCANYFSEDNSNDLAEKRSSSLNNRAKSPIVFDLQEEKSNHSQRSIRERDGSPKRLEKEDKKRSARERLGTQNSRSDRSRKSKELYIPAHRRKELENNNHNSKERDRSRSPKRSNSPKRRSRERIRNLSGSRERRRNGTPDPRSIRTPRNQSLSPELEGKGKESSKSSDIVRKRIGSRVIVAPAKTIESSDDEDLNDKPVNSVIKIKPRSKVSPSKQACKNLLLKAVADAQRSTILAKKPKEKLPATERLGRRESVGQSSKQLYTKSIKNRLGHEASGELFKRTTQNLIVEVQSRSSNKKHYEYEQNHRKAESDREGDYDMDDDGYSNHEDKMDYDNEDHKTFPKTQFVVTLDEEKARSKLRKRALRSRSTTRSPLPLVTSSTSSASNYKKTAAISPSHSRIKTGDIRSRLSPSIPSKKTDLIEVYRKPKEVKKIIIKPDTDEDDEHFYKSAGSSKGRSSSPEKEQAKYSKSTLPKKINNPFVNERSTTPPLPPSMAHLTANKSTEKKTKDKGREEDSSPSFSRSLSPKKRKHEVIKFDLDGQKVSKESQKENLLSPVKKSRRSDSVERDRDRSSDRKRDSSHERHEDRRKISTRKAEDRKYDNIPSLSSVPVDTSALKPFKTKERCIYHPNCTKNVCEYYHPSAPCKAFPNCKFGDKCLYTHPKCKYDLACMNAECNYMHTGTRNLPTAPPISSHVVPVQSYKSISAVSAPTTGGVMCKYYPNCTKAGCSFYHPKACRYGKNCINKLECSYYHPEVQSCNKFKWVAQTG